MISKVGQIPLQVYAHQLFAQVAAGEQAHGIGLGDESPEIAAPEGDQDTVGPLTQYGFKVGGKTYDGKKFPVANGTQYGQGVYSATGPNTPMSYSRDGNNSIILAMALKGKFAPSQAAGLDSWSNGSARSDWLIFADDEQVLPVYVVHYQK